MTHRTYPEIVGAVPVDTGSTPGEPTGVRAIKATESVNAEIVNRALHDTWLNTDLLDFFARKEIAQPTFVDRTSAGESTYDLSGRIYCGESAADDTAERIFRYFRLTDQQNNPLVVDGDRVLVKEVLDGAGASQVGVKRSLVSGTISITYDRQTLTHASGSHLFTYCQVGDEVVLSGGTPNDGTYIIVEVISDYSLRVRSSTGVETAFTSGAISTTLLVRTNGYSSHKQNGGETYDTRLVFSKEIPAATTYRVHYHTGTILRDLSRIFVGGMRPQDAYRRPVSLQTVYDGSLGHLTPNRQGGLGSQRVQNTRGEIVFDRQASTQGVFGSSIREVENSGATLSVGMVQQQKYSLSGAAGLHLYKRQTLTGLSIESAVADKITDKTLQTSASADLSTISGNIVQSGSLNFTSEGVTVGMTLRVTSAPTVYYRVIQVAPGGDNARLRLYPTPPSWTNESFEVYSRIFESTTQPKLVANNMIAVAYAGLPSTAAGSTTANSNIFEDLTTNFSTSGVKAGDILYILTDGMNATKKYVVDVVAPGSNVNRLQMTEEFPETGSSLSYKLLDPTLLEGRAFIVEDFRGAQLTVAMLNGISTTWSFSRDNISVDLYDVLSAKGNFLTTSSGEVLDSANLLSVQSRHTDGLFNAIPSGISNYSILPANDQSTKGILQTSILFPPNLAKGLTTFSTTAWVRVGEHADNYVDTMGLQLGDVIIPLEGADRLVEMTITDRSASWVKVSPAPTWDSVSDYPVPFVVRRAGGSMLASGAVKATSFSYEASQYVRKTMSALGIVGNSGSSVEYLDGGFKSTATPWEGLLPLPLQEGDVLKYVDVRVTLGSAQVDPNNSSTLVARVINKFTGTSTKTLLTPYEDGGGPGLGLAAAIEANSKVVSITGASGDLTTLVGPGCYLLVDDGGGNILFFTIEAVISATQVVIKEAHGLSTASYDAIITNGRPSTGAALSSQNWITSYVLATPYTVLEGDYLHLEYGDTVAGMIVGYDIIYKPGGLF